ncbi:unnamed protein product [Paramecium pentaurelia]|uniref:Uncharacterized protein n=1 Tax=Paramecium pentaurelia TaxID=43138 RepID=A0A8S1XFV0_9CILI|nr:unnamed protein product [Paramecium pentaurelia]
MEGTDSYNYDEMDLDELMLPPPALIRQNAFIQEEDETPQFILTTQTECTYKEEECPICFCPLNEENTVKLFIQKPQNAISVELFRLQIYLVYVLNDIVGTLLKIYFQIKIRKIHPKDILDLYLKFPYYPFILKIIKNLKNVSIQSNFIREIIQKMAFCQLSHFQYSRYNIYLQISVQNKIISELFQNQGFGLETYSKQHKNTQYKFNYLSELMINLFQKKENPLKPQ